MRRDGRGAGWPSYFGAGLATALGFLALRPLGSRDFWWHLSMGRATLEAGSPVFPDPVAVGATADYVNVVWLFDVVLYLLHRAGGLVAVNLATAGLAALAFVVTWRLAREHAGASAPWIALAVAALGAGAAHLRMVPRPQATFLTLLPLLMLLGRRAAAGRGRTSWGLAAAAVATVAAWTQLHASVVIAPAVFAAATLDWTWTPGAGWKGAWPGRLQIGTFLVLSLLPLAGPSGVDLVRRAVEHGDNYVVRHIEEMQALSLDLWQSLSPDVLLVKLLLLLAVFGLTRRPRLEVGPVLLALLGFALALGSNRFVSAWGLLLVPLAAGALRPAEEPAEGRARAVAALLVVAGVPALLALGARAPSFSTAPVFASGASRALGALGVRGTVFTDYDQGGFIGWQHYGEVRPIVDSRSHTRFELEEVYAAARALGEPRIFDRLHALHGFRAAVVPQGTPLCRVLSVGPTWRTAWHGGGWALFLPAADALPAGSRRPRLDPCSAAYPVDACLADAAPEAFLEEVDALLALTPDEPYLGRLAAALALECGVPVPGERLASYLQAAMGEADHPDVRWLSARVVMQRDPQAALRLVEGLPSTHRRGRVLQLRLLRQLDRPAAALPIARELVERLEDEDIPRLRELLAWACEETGDLECAVRQTLRAALAGDESAGRRLRRYRDERRVPPALLPLAGAALGEPGSGAI